MTNLVQKFEKEQINKLTSKKRIPAFRPGDTLKVTLKIVEGEKSRLQAYEGLCISRKNNSVNSKFTVRKMSHGEGVERVFPLFSPNIDKIEVIRKGDVKRAKLYYLRDRTGKSARIADRDRGNEIDQYELSEAVEVPVEAAQVEEAPVDEEAPVEAAQVEEEKSESPASEAENTENESKS
jgi:large subunit ribosomal protein L19